MKSIPSEKQTQMPVSQPKKREPNQSANDYLLTMFSQEQIDQMVHQTALRKLIEKGRKHPPAVGPEGSE